MTSFLALMLASSHAVAGGAAVLSIAGACPGAGSVDVTGLAPNGKFAVFRANGPGTHVFSGGPCPGLVLGLDSGSQGLLTTGQASGAGEVHLSPNLSAQVCGRAVQVVDRTTCQTSNVAFIDGDGDGVAHPADCDDGNGDIFPGATEIPADGVDQDCDFSDDCWLDADLDGVGGSLPVAGNDMDCTDNRESSTSGDCDDNDPTSYPGAPLGAIWVGDGADRDCNGFEECFPDQDGDGVGGSTIIDDDGDGVCRASQGELTTAGDCNDNDANAYPGALEVCDDQRTNCSDASWSGDGGMVTWFADDGDVVDLSALFASGSPGITPTIALSNYVGAFRAGRLAVCEGTYNVRLTANATFTSLTIEGHTGAGTTPPDLDAGGGEHVLEASGPTQVTGVQVTGSIGFYPTGDGDDVSVTNSSVSDTLSVAMPVAAVTLTDVSAANLEVAGFSDTVATRIDVEYLAYDGAWGQNTLIDATLGGLSISNASVSFTDILVDQGSGVGVDISSGSLTGAGLTVRAVPFHAILLTNSSSMTAEGPVLIEDVGWQAAVVQSGSTLSLSDGEVRDTVGYAFDVTGDLQLTGVLVHNTNSGGTPVLSSAALIHDGGSLTCDGGTSGGGFVDNHGGVAAIYLEQGGVTDVYSQACQWGTAGVDDNSPADLWAGGPHDYDGVASFHCTTDGVSGCSPL